MQEAEASKVANNITLYRDAYHVRPIGNSKKNIIIRIFQN